MSGRSHQGKPAFELSVSSISAALTGGGTGGGAVDRTGSSTGGSGKVALTGPSGFISMAEEAAGMAAGLNMGGGGGVGSGLGGGGGGGADSLTGSGAGPSSIVGADTWFTMTGGTRGTTAALSQSHFLKLM